MKEADFIIVSGLDKPRFWSYYQSAGVKKGHSSRTCCTLYFPPELLAPDAIWYAGCVWGRESRLGPRDTQQGNAGRHLHRAWKGESMNHKQIGFGQIRAPA